MSTNRTSPNPSEATADRVVNIPLLLRGFGVLLAIASFLSVGTWVHQPPPKDLIGYFLPGLGLLMSVLVCVPFSRIRSPATFWTLLSTFAVAFVSFVALHGWFAIHELGTPAFRLNLIAIMPVALLLLVQFPCILYTWSHRHHEP